MAVALGAGCVRSGFESWLIAETPEDDGAVARYDFDEGAGDQVVDALGGHDGAIVGDGVSWAESFSGSGLGLAFSDDPARTGFAEIPDDPAWDLTEGSLELWLRPGPAPDGLAMLIGRDAEGEHDGHFSLGIASEGRLFARIQHQGLSQVQCSEPVATGVWLHVAVNFGPPAFEFYLDGQRVISDPGVIVDGSACGGAEPFGIDGNDNPWVIGASNWASVEGTGRPVSNFIHGAMVDQLCIRGVRVDWSAR